MKTKLLAIAGLALLVGGFFLFSNRPESSTQPQTVAVTTKAEAEMPAPKQSFGGSFRVKTVTISDKTQPTVQPN